MMPANDASGPATIPVGVTFIRRLAIPTAILLLALAGRNLAVAHTPPTIFFQIKGILEILLAAGFLFPFHRCPKPRWIRAFTLFVIGAILYGLLTVVGVIFAYMEAAREGGDLGLPAFEGTLLFVVFIQIPAIFFQRYPDEWE